MYANPCPPPPASRASREHVAGGATAGGPSPTSHGAPQPAAGTPAAQRRERRRGGPACVCPWEVIRGTGTVRTCRFATLRVALSSRFGSRPCPRAWIIQRRPGGHTVSCNGRWRWAGLQPGAWALMKLWGSRGPPQKDARGASAASRQSAWSRAAWYGGRDVACGPRTPISAGAYASGRRQVEGRRTQPGRPRSGWGERTPHADHVWRKAAVPAALSWEQDEPTRACGVAQRAHADPRGAGRRGPSRVSG